MICASTDLFSQVDETTDLKKKNEESIELLKQKIAALEGSIDEEEPSVIETKSIIVLKDSIRFLEEELKACSNAHAERQAISNKFELKEGLTFYYQRDVYKLKKEDEKQLDQFVKSLPQSYNMIVVKGHADVIGEDYYNDKISKKRAEEIRDYLLNEHNISPDKVLINWSGSESPGADAFSTNDDRRCEIMFL